jgi:hypothetical protein
VEKKSRQQSGITSFLILSNKSAFGQLIIMGKKSNGDPNLIRKGLTRGKREELKKLVDELLQSKSQLFTSNCLLAVIKFL